MELLIEVGDEFVGGGHPAGLRFAGEDSGCARTGPFAMRPCSLMDELVVVWEGESPRGERNVVSVVSAVGPAERQSGGGT